MDAFLEEAIKKFNLGISMQGNPADLFNDAKECIEAAFRYKDLSPYTAEYAGLLLKDIKVKLRDLGNKY